MKILLTGANGYIGMRLLPQLLELGHEVICAVRDENRLSIDEQTKSQLQIIEIDFLKEYTPGCIPMDIDVAYYLIHSMSSSTTDFDDKEALSAETFNQYMA
ncbi:MAG: NAD(P)H-binding protein, partial [Maribacter sp.]|nr:NAD(P)H-binding protein [Maribacter sp.]